jgi:pre-mRNA 3'-end-processing factor FIP1
MASDHEDEDDDLYDTAVEAKIDIKHLKDEDEASSGDEPMDEGADSGDDEEDDDDDSESVSQP